MRHNEFYVGLRFWMSDSFWQCTDVGGRVIVAIKLEPITQVFKYEDGREEIIGHLTLEEALKQGYYSGPPYSCVEHTIDEHDQAACSYDKEGNGTDDSALPFGTYVWVGEGPSKHKEWRPKPRMMTKKRAPEHLELMRQLRQESDENAQMEILRRINEVKNRG